MFGLLFPDYLRALCIRCFDYTEADAADPARIRERPTALEWYQALDRLDSEDLARCARDPQHCYLPGAGTLGRDACPWCERDEHFERAARSIVRRSSEAAGSGAAPSTPKAASPGTTKAASSGTTTVAAAPAKASGNAKASSGIANFYLAIILVLLILIPSTCSPGNISGPSSGNRVVGVDTQSSEESTLTNAITGEYADDIEVVRFDWAATSHAWSAENVDYRELAGIVVRNVGEHQLKLHTEFGFFDGDGNVVDSVTDYDEVAPGELGLITHNSYIDLWEFKSIEEARYGVEVSLDASTELPDKYLPVEEVTCTDDTLVLLIKNTTDAKVDLFADFWVVSENWCYQESLWESPFKPGKEKIWTIEVDYDDSSMSEVPPLNTLEYYVVARGSKSYG